jgi:hypothetical protein
MWLASDLIFKPSALVGLASHHLEPSILGQSQHVKDTVIALIEGVKEGHDGRHGEVAVATNDDVEVSKAGFESVDEAVEDVSTVATVVNIAGAQDHSDELVVLVENGQGKEHALIVKSMKEGQFLLAMNGVSSAIDVEYDEVGVRSEILNIGLFKSVDDGAHGVEVEGIVKAGECGLRRKAIVIGQEVTGEFDDRIVTNVMGVVGVLVAKAQPIDALAQLLKPAVDDPVRVSVVREQRSEVLCEPKPVVDLTQKQCPAIRRQSGGVKTDIDVL